MVFTCNSAERVELNQEPSLSLCKLERARYRRRDATGGGRDVFYSRLLLKARSAMQQVASILDMKIYTCAQMLVFG